MTRAPSTGLATAWRIAMVELVAALAYWGCSPSVYYVYV